MSEPQTHEQRSLPRHRLSAPITVVDRNRNLTLGRLVDLHSEGLMLMGDQPLQVDHLYQLDLYLPQPLQGETLLQLGVDCLWTRCDEGAVMHWSGFQIIDLSERAARQIEELVELLGTP